MEGTTNQHDLEGRGVVVTGGSGHLGAPIARSVLQRGGLVVSIARGEDALTRLRESCGSDARRLVSVIGDVRDPLVIAAAIGLLLSERNEDRG